MASEVVSDVEVVDDPKFILVISRNQRIYGAVFNIRDTHT